MKHLKDTHRAVALLLGASTLFIATGCATKEICGKRVQIRKGPAFGVNENERRLICGDPHLEPWQDVPMAQSQFHLKSFFRDKGYYEPSFTAEGDILWVNPGPRSNIKEIEFVGAPEGFFDLRYTGYRDERLTSKTLDELQSWTLRRLKNLGYACAKIKLAAASETEKVRVEIETGTVYEFPTIDYADAALSSQIVRRYDAFFAGDRYRQDLLDLTNSRLESSGVVAHSTFLPECQKREDGPSLLKITQKVALGHPRLLRIGVGVSTEEFPIGRFFWGNTRLGDNASILTGEIYLSNLNQTAKVAFEWHPSMNASRWYLRPEFENSHINERNQEYLRSRVAVIPGGHFDLHPLALRAEMGPAQWFDDIKRGADLGGRNFTTWESLFEVTSHDYQIHAGSPQEGYWVKVATSSILASSADTGGHRILIDSSQLWSLIPEDPPAYIIGYRAGVRTIAATRGSLGQLPADYFFWMGGERDLRGFYRQELGIQDHTTAFIGFEFRAPAWLPRGFDPLFFYDVGKLGAQGDFKFDPGLYTSLGLGLRWQSPIGSLRTTLARGFRSEEARASVEHLQFFLSLGQEF